MTPRPAHVVLDEIIHQHTVAQHHLDRLGRLIASYRELVPAPDETGTAPSRRRGRVKSAEAWVGWLSDNGPAYRKTVAEAVGNLAANASPLVRQWKEHMEIWPDDQLPGDTLMNIQGPKPSGSKGRPQVIYFLWSQRYDVLPSFGVGPSSPTTNPTLSDPTDASGESEPQTLTGVVRPPTEYDWNGAENWPQQALDFAQDIGEVRTAQNNRGSDQ